MLQQADTLAELTPCCPIVIHTTLWLSWSGAIAKYPDCSLLWPPGVRVGKKRFLRKKITKAVGFYFLKLKKNEDSQV